MYKNLSTQKQTADVKLILFLDIYLVVGLCKSDTHNSNYTVFSWAAHLKKVLDELLDVFPRKESIIHFIEKQKR